MNSREHGLAVLARLAERRPERVDLLRRALSGRLSTMLDPAFDLAARGAPAIGDALALLLAESRDLELARDLHARIHPNTIALRPLALLAATIYRDGLRADVNPVDPVELAAVYNNLGLRLSAMGRSDAAIDALGTAVELERKLVAEKRGDLSGLGAALLNLATALSEASRAEEGVTYTVEAVECFRALAKDGGEDELEGLGQALNNLGLRSFELGRLDQARAHLLEAASIQRPLAKSSPSYNLPSLAVSLANLCNVFRELGELDAAEKYGVEAVELLELIADENPDGYALQLALAAIRLAELHQSKDEHDVARRRLLESLAVLRPMLDRNAESAVTGWVYARNALAEVEGARIADRGVQLARETIATLEAIETPGPRVADALFRLRNNLAVALNERGAFHEALDQIRAAKQLALPDLSFGGALAATELAALRGSSLDGRAIELARHVIDAVREGSDGAVPTSLLCDAISTLEDLGGDPSELLSATDVALHRWNVSDAHDPERANVWRARGIAMSELGRCEEGLAWVEQAVDVFRALQATDARHTTPLTAALNSRALIELELGRAEDAFATAESILTLFPWDDTAPAAARVAAGVGEYTAGIALLSLGRAEEALAWAVESVEHLASIGDEAAVALHLENAAGLLARSLFALGRTEEAEQVLSGRFTIDREDE